MTDTANTSILIVDPYVIYREGLKKLLEQESDFTVVADTGDADVAVRAVVELDPHVLLAGISGRPLLRLLKRLKEATADTARVRTVLLTSKIDKPHLVQLLQLGVADILVNDSCSQTLFTSIRATVAGDETGRARLTEMASGAAKPEQAAPQAREDRFGLTPRELDIIAAVGRGETNRAIAHQLSITHDTVKHHLTNIFDKLGVFTRLQLVLFAMQHGLVEAGARLAAQMTA